MKKFSCWCRGIAVIAIAVMAIDTVAAQPWGGWGRRSERVQIPERDIFPRECFTFCRVLYQSHGGRRRGGSCWTDYPDSDMNFSQRLGELTHIRINRHENGEVKHAVVDLLDEDLYNYPFIYMIEVGSLYFSPEEAEALRDYLLRGGFLMVDDFWGEDEWRNFEFEFSKVFPPEEFPIVDIPLEHEIFHIVFELDEYPQIPGLGMWERSGQTFERWDAQEPHYRGVFDPNGRLMCVIAHNTDLGDGWEEEAKNPVYFDQFSKRKAYPLGINIVVYAMTH